MRYLVCGAFLTSILAVMQSPLEAALRPSSNVTAEVQFDEEDEDNALVISGDTGNNFIVIVDVGPFRLVVGLNGTTVNDQAFDFFSKRDLQDTLIDMGAGDDHVVIVSRIAGEEEFEAEGGLGDDTILALEEIDVEEGVMISGFETIIPEDLGS
jgi:hypothetical protein